MRWWDELDPGEKQILGLFIMAAAAGALVILGVWGIVALIF